MKDPEYIMEDAIAVVYNNISDELKAKLSKNDIEVILDIGTDYLVTLGAAYEDDLNKNEVMDVDMDKMYDYVVENAAKHQIILDDDQVSEIFDAEEIYLREIGVIED
jgi:hypothetical protein